MSFGKHILAINAAVMAVIVGLVGCGSAGGGSANAQGTSFLALGFFHEGGSSEGDLPEGDAGTIVIIDETVPGSQGVFPLFVPVDKDPTQPGIQGGFLGLENRITTQFITTQRMDCDYYVAGSSISIPSDAWHFTSAIPAATIEEAQGGGTVVVGSRTFNQVEIISPDVMQFLNVNRNSLPKLPFRLTASCRAIGTTQAGDTLTTNDVLYSVQFVDEPDLGVTPGSSNQGPGTGGDLDDFGDADQEETD